MSGFDYSDAPPLDDRDVPFAPLPGEPDPNTVANGIVINRLVHAIEGLTQAIERMGPSGPPGGAPAPAQPPGPSGPPTAPPGGNNDESQIKRGKAIYAKCMNQNPPADIKAIGQHVTGHPMHGNSQKWTEADQVMVLEAMKTWGWT